MDKDRKVQAQKLRAEVADALEVSKNVRATIRRGPKVTRYTITFSVPRSS